MKKINSIIDTNFLSTDELKKLVEDLKELNFKDQSVIHGGRIYLANTDQEFLNLISSSPSWNSLYQKINSPEFFSYCQSSLNLSEDKIVFEKFFTKEIPEFFKRIHKLRDRRIKETSYFGIVAYTIYLGYRYLLFIYFQKISQLMGRNTTELLFDISLAGNGYSREIHRDSDSRYIVFLIYLNELQGAGEGGSLDLHEYAGDEFDDPPAKPDIDDCRLIQSIKPAAGQLVIFQNNKYAFHSVPVMEADIV